MDNLVDCVEILTNKLKAPELGCSKQQIVCLSYVFLFLAIHVKSDLTSNRFIFQVHCFHKLKHLDVIEDLSSKYVTCVSLYVVHTL